MHWSATIERLVPSITNGLVTTSMLCKQNNAVPMNSHMSASVRNVDRGAKAAIYSRVWAREPRTTKRKQR